VNFSFDDEVVATTTEDENAQFWTLDGLQLASFNIHLNKIRSATFSPDGLKFATASQDKTASVLTIRDLPELIKEGCKELTEHFKNHPSDKERLPICSSN
jgi:WD40 repeat protein